jgi:L-malate glycosyltransferase
MRILNLIDSVPRGGTETLLFDFAKNVISSNTTSFVVTLGRGAMFDDFINLNINFKHFQRKYPIDLSVIIKIRSLLLNENIDIIHTHSDVVAVHAYLASRFLNKKLVLTFHGNTYKDKFNFKRNLSLKFLVPKMNACIAVSKSYLQVLKERSLFPTQGFNVIYNGVDFRKFAPIKGSLKNELNLPDNTFLIGMIGNFNWVRDQLSICKALPKVFKKIPNARFVFVGSRSEQLPEVYDECITFCEEQGILDKVFFIGRRKDIPNILYSLNLYLYASKSDSFGISLIEAMFCKVPLLINDLPVFLELTQNGKYATIFKSGDTHDIVEKVSAIYNSCDDNSLAESTKQYVNDNFSIEKYITNLTDLYQKLIR